jgi:Protein of unknown function (DUF4199)
MLKRLPPLIAISLRYGLIAGITGFVLLISLFYIGWHPFLVPVFFDFRIVIFSVLIVFCLRELREYYFGGLLFFWQGMIASFIITFVFAVIASLLLLNFTYLVPDFVTQFITLSLEQVKTYTAEDIQRIGKEIYEQGVKSLKEADGAFMATRYFFQSFIISFFISIIISVILRRQPPTA